jgi:hypothetical protein
MGPITEQTNVSSNSAVAEQTTESEASPLGALGIGTTVYFTQQRVMTYYFMFIALFGIGMMVVYRHFYEAQNQAISHGIAGA